MKDSKLKWKLVSVYEKCYSLNQRIRREFRYWAYTRRFKLRIMSVKKTLDYINKTGCSIARFGDGEFDMISGVRDLKFQKYSPELGLALERVLSEKNENLLLCIPGTFKSIKGCNWHAAMYWSRWGIDEKNLFPIFQLLRCYCGKRYLFGNAQITRPYVDLENHSKSAATFLQIKNLWKGKDVLIIEGEQTRLGVGNDLFENVNSIKRILVPAVGAFEKYSQILKEVLTFYNNQLVLLAIGPTATVLASDLSKRGIQAIDVGHVDIEYEWFIAGADGKTVIKNKFVNEAIGGQMPEECNDKDYLSQIVINLGDDNG